MKCAKILHYISLVITIIGFLTLIAAWIARDGTFLGQTQQHFFYDTFAFFMLAILFALGTIIHYIEENLIKK